MPYYFTCPLCLVRLGRGHGIKMFKKSARGSSSRRVDCGKPDFIEELLRFSGKDIYVPVGERAVYASHDRCKAVNPFWDKAKNEIVIPGSDKEGKGLLAELECKVTYKMFRKQLFHWMVKTLRDALEFGNDYAPMWFPLQLLLSTATEDGDGLKREYGHLVEMASTKSAGKTILTLQILNQALYRNGREVNVRDFFYPNADHDDTELRNFQKKFCKEMFYHSTWQETPIARPSGTQPSAGDLRAVFVQAISPGEESIEVIPKSPSDNRLLQLASKYVFRPVVLFFRETFRVKPKKQKPEKKEPVPALKDILEKWKKHYWNPIIFYDTAGELQRSSSPVTQAVRQLTNKLAICIDAREIFDHYEPIWPTDIVEPSDVNASIKHATQRIAEIEDAPEYKKATCIVITKLDVVLSPEEKERVKLIAEDPNGDEAALKLLIKWLTDHGGHHKSSLRSLLLRRPALVDRVFFVWTENLPRMFDVRISPIKQIQPAIARPGDKVTLEANSDFNFNDAQKITFNGVDSDFTIESKSVIKAIVPEGATSGLVGILLKGQIAQAVGQTSTTYIDDATSDMAFIVKPDTNSDASKPRSYGLIKFLAWCLDKKVDEISRQTGD